MLILILLLGTAFAPQTADKPAGKILMVVPSATVGGKDATVGMPFKENDTLQTGDAGRLHAQLNDGSSMWLGVKAAVHVLPAALELKNGRVRLTLPNTKHQEGQFVIHDHFADIEIHGGADLAVDDSSPTETIVSVSEGKVTATSTKTKATVQLTAGQWRISQDPDPIRMVTPQ